MPAMDDSELMALAASLARTRTVRRPGIVEPKVSDRYLFGTDSKRQREFRKYISDPTMGFVMGNTRGLLKKHAKIVAMAGPVWEQLVPRDCAERAVVATIERGKVVIGVPDHGVKFRVDRMLRAGGRTEFLRRMPSGTRDVEVRVGATPAITPAYPRINDALLDDRERDLTGGTPA